MKENYFFSKKNNKQAIYLILVFLIECLSFIETTRDNVPYDTYYYVVKADPSLFYDKLTYSFQLLHTPSYYFISIFYDHPLTFFFLCFFSNLVFSILIFYLINSLIKNNFISFFSVILFSPASLALLSKLLVDPGLRPIHVFGYGSYIFSTRYLLGFFTILSIYFFLRKKIYKSIIFYFLLLLCHPSSGLIYGLIFLSIILFNKFNFKIILSFIVASFLGLLNTFLKLSKLSDLKDDLLISKKKWYSNLIQDEPDDFSILFQILNQYNNIIFYILIISIILLALTKFKKKLFIKYKSLSLFIFLPFFFFLFFAIIEFFSTYFNFYFFIDIIIQSQLSYKILKFSYFPIVFATAIILNQHFLSYEILRNFIYKYNLKFTKIFIFFIITWIYFDPTNKIEKKIEFIKNLNNITTVDYISYLNTIYKSDQKNYAQGNLYIVDMIKPTEITNSTNIFQIQKFSNTIKKNKQLDKQTSIYAGKEAFESLISAIKETVPNRSDIIIMPYILYIRDIFPNHNFYYLEKPDGNLAMGSRKVATIINERMKDLLDADYMDLLPNQSHLLHSDIRKRYLNINEEKINYLKNKYPTYKYFITESSHILKFEIISKNNFYIIYKI